MFDSIVTGSKLHTFPPVTYVGLGEGMLSSVQLNCTTLSYRETVQLLVLRLFNWHCLCHVIVSDTYRVLCVQCILGGSALLIAAI